MFVKQIRCVLASAIGLAMHSKDSWRAGTLTPSVVAGGVLIAATLFGASALVSPAHGAGFQIADPSNACASWSWNSGTSTLTCNAAQAPAAGTPSGCSLTASTSTITGPTNVTLTATCTSNASDQGTTWTWTGAGASSPTTGASPQTQVVQNVSATTTFSVTATNATGPGPTRSATVTRSGGGGGGGAGVSISCTNYAKTTVLNFPYTIGGGQQTQVTGGQGANEIVVATFTTPGTVGIPSIGVADNIGPTTGFTAWISSTPDGACNLPTDPTKIRRDLLSTSWNKTVLPNTTYYISILATDPIWVTLTPK